MSAQEVIVVKLSAFLKNFLPGLSIKKQKNGFPLFHYNTVLEQLRRCNDLNVLDVFKDTTIEYLKFKALNEMDNRNLDNEAIDLNNLSDGYDYVY